MTFYVNAWLDRSDPFISLHNRDTGETVARFEKEALQECLDQGEFCLSELCDPSPRVQQELVKCLLLAQCYRDVHHQLESIYHNFFPRTESAPIIPFRAKQLAAQQRQREFA